MRPQVSSTAAGHKTAAVRPCRCFLRRRGDGCDGARPIIRTAMERNCEGEHSSGHASLLCGRPSWRRGAALWWPPAPPMRCPWGEWETMEIRSRGDVVSPHRRNSWTRSSSVICFPLPSTMVTFGFPSKSKKQACAKAVGRSLHVSMVIGPGTGMSPCVTVYGIFPLIFLEREPTESGRPYAKRHSDHNR